MTIKNGSMPAMPQSVAIGPSGDVEYSERAGGGGLTKREQFAAMAMQGLMVNAGRDSLEFIDSSEVAKKSIEAADALLAQLEEKGE